ncbi:hypothetical protein BH10ACI1_BH10ACI1_28690 [soil metagenome]
MLAFIYSFIFIFAEVAPSNSESSWGKFVHWWDTYANYPGFEAWKFFNLTVFIFIMVYLLKKPLGDAFKAKREAIRADLIAAEEKRQAALAKLTVTEAKLASLETESANVLTQAEMEAKAEKERIAGETTDEIKRLQAQAANEIERKSQQVRAELRRFSAEESIRLAEEKLKAQINPENDARLVKAGIQSIGGLN